MSVPFEEWRDALQLSGVSIGTNIDAYRLEIAARIADVEKCLAMKVDADFVWTIDRLGNSDYFESEYFHGLSQRRLMRLLCDWRCDGGDYVLIYLRFHCGKKDTDLQWPFDRRVTITITNKESPTAYRAVTDRCLIVKPPHKSYLDSDAFTFTYIDLSNAGLLLGNRVTVQCTIHDE